MGQVGGAAATGYAATFVQAFLDLQWSSWSTAHRTVLITALIIVVQGLAMDLV
ncbi:hypothetical protein MBT84_35110 [Streptomyces sp. MBT84]|nr:hypothetical protein [Streptomyces sp. MBT84]